MKIKDHLSKRVFAMLRKVSTGKIIVVRNKNRIVGLYLEKKLLCNIEVFKLYQLKFQSREFFG